MAEWYVSTRRSFLAQGLTAGVAGGCGLLSAGRRDPFARPEQPDRDDDPIARMPDGPVERRFFGDEPDRFHGLVRDKAGALQSRGGLPMGVVAGVERAKVVIVGSGLAGLSAAWRVRDLAPVVLEGGSRFGGNAKAQKWGDLTYGIGSAYFGMDSRRAEHIRMLRRIGVARLWREDYPIHDSMFIGGKVVPGFWFGGTDPARAADFRATWEYFEQIREHAYPDVPFDDEGDVSREDWEALDGRTFEAELRARLGDKLHPHIEDMIREYCWSSFGADYTEISALAGLNFLSSDLGGMYVLPGGNAAIAQGLVEALRQELPQGHLRSSAMVLDVRLLPEGVRVVYTDGSEKLQVILADTCIVTSPKFVAKRLIDDLPPRQKEAIDKLEYRAYLVASVLVDQPREPDFHDLFCIAGEKVTDLQAEVEKRVFTDALLATFARDGHPSKTVMNLYCGMPFDGARAHLILPEAYDNRRAQIEGALPALFSAINLDVAKVRDIRLTRWGHALVIPRPGHITGGVCSEASAPFGGRVFFAQQDNFALSSFESSFSAAVDATDGVRRVLG